MNTEDTIDWMEREWQKAKKLMPAWFMTRMMSDHWTFGLLLSNNTVLVISQIDAVHQAADGSIWIDVEMQEHRFIDHYEEALCTKVTGAPTARLQASINVAHIICAIEMADT